MDFRTLLVHITANDDGDARLDSAIELARRLGARLVGMGAYGFDPEPDPTGLSHRILLEWIAESLQKAEATFRKKTSTLPDTAWIADRRSPGRALAAHACGADLVVASRSAQATAPAVFARPDELILSAGTPVLVQPPKAGPLAARRIVVGWKNTRESRRALWDGLPLLERADLVKLVRFETSDQPDGSLDEVAARLRRHNVALDVERRRPTRSTVGADLIEMASREGADLIVAGGYGRSRIRELVLGGVTKSLLDASPHYVLFSH